MLNVYQINLSESKPLPGNAFYSKANKIKLNQPQFSIVGV